MEMHTELHQRYADKTEGATTLVFAMGDGGDGPYLHGEDTEQFEPFLLPSRATVWDAGWSSKDLLPLQRVLPLLALTLPPRGSYYDECTVYHLDLHTGAISYR